MNKKAKGSNAEREIVHMFWRTQDWTAVRVAGSGSNKYPSPDIIAGNKTRKLAIECKAVKGKSKYFPLEEINNLKLYCNKFSAEAWIGIRFDNEKWYFVMLEDLIPKTKNYAITRDLIKIKGLLFEELIK